MTPKEQLRALPTMQQRIDMRVKLIEHYMEQAERMGGALKAVVVSSSKEQSPMERWVDKAIDLAQDISKEVDALRAERRLICGIVEQIPNPRHRQVLEMRYFAHIVTRWEDIAEVMGVDVRHVYRLHGEALLQYARIAGNVSKCH